jgi:alanyl-tRNA synthetase
MTDEEIGKVEAIVNAKIRENISLHVDENIPLEKAMKEMGAVGVFGEKYGDFVRVVTFDKCFSIELCGGTHVPATGQIGLFKILSESAIAAGIRRIEAVTAGKAEGFVNSELKLLEDTREMLKHPKDLLKGLKGIIEENTALKKQIEQYKKEKVNQLKEELMLKAEKLNSISFIAHKVDIDTTSVKDLAFLLNISIENIFLILGNESEDKANITIMISENLVKEKSLNAGVLIRELAKEIDGGGGGQAHFATAGGRNPKGIPAALAKAREIVMKL